MKKIILLVCLIFSSFAVAQTPVLPVEYFGSLPDVSSVRLSPDGNKLAAVIRVDAESKKGTAVQVIDLNTKEKKLVLFTDNKTYDILNVSWKGSEHLLVDIFYSDSRETGYGKPIKTREFRLLVVDVKNASFKEAFSKAFINKYEFPPTSLNEVVDSLSEDPDHLLMQIKMGLLRIDANYPSVVDVNLKDQTVKTVQDQKENVWSWITDRQHRVRAGLYEKDGINKILVKDVDGGDFKELWSYKEFSKEEVDVLGFDLDPNLIYINAYQNGRKAIFKVNLKDPELKRTLIISDDNYDVEGLLIYSKITDEVVGIATTNSNSIIFYEPSLKRLQMGINKALSQTKNYITGMSDDQQKYLLFATSDTKSGSYYIGDRKKGGLDEIAYRYKNLTPDLMSPKKSYKYKARDGLEIEAYLSLPLNVEAKNLKTIMLPHGGPISNDDDDFDYWVQFLTNRGYAVLQMNFRGSEGKGLDFRNAGLKNWGLQMQDDIEDGAKSLIAEGITDPKSICIVGASYGGYAALEGVVKTPNFYQCAVSVAGVSDVEALVKDARAFWLGYNVVDEQIGNNYSHLRDISPVNHADQIKVPVLLIHGDSDRQVDVKHSRVMNEKLKKLGRNVTYLELPDEDHYLTNNQNRVATFKAIDEFLAKYLPVKK